jgi:citrate synthase
MMDKHITDLDYKPQSKITKAFEPLFILQAEHELNCPNAIIRHWKSSQSYVYTTLADAFTVFMGQYMVEQIKQC